MVDRPNFCDAANKYSPTEILGNLDKVQEKARIIAVNLTHLQQSNLCNHAFGMQIADGSDFFPNGNGLTNDGRKVAKGLFDRACLLYTSRCV